MRAASRPPAKKDPWGEIVQAEETGFDDPALQGQATAGDRSDVPSRDAFVPDGLNL